MVRIYAYTFCVCQGRCPDRCVWNEIRGASSKISAHLSTPWQGAPIEYVRIYDGSRETLVARASAVPLWHVRVLLGTWMALSIRPWWVQAAWRGPKTVWGCVP